MNRRVFSARARSKCALLLEDGSLYQGKGVGAHGMAIGELCFNTTMSGYQEVITDPSYAEQIIVFSFPHIGNVGVCAQDSEGSRVHARGCIFSQAPTERSNWRSEENFSSWLRANGVIGLYDLDTRSLVRRLREYGAQRAAIINEEGGFLLIKSYLSKIKAWPGLSGSELAQGVAIKKQYEWQEPLGNAVSSYSTSQGSRERVRKQPSENSNRIESENISRNIKNGNDRDNGLHIVAVDFGIKHQILRCLSAHGARVTVVPPSASSDDILSLRADGVFLSNGPGDPEASSRYAKRMIVPLLSSKIPIFGICLGFQLLALAFGGRSEKMPFGHHGANHPVKDLKTGRVEITSQNHSFAISLDSLPRSKIEVTHVSLFDKSLEGFSAKNLPVFAVQYHPEASPGPHDSAYLFARFFNDCRKYGASHRIDAKLEQ